MKPRVVTVTQKIDLAVTPEWLAKLFCELDDDEQAQFFVEVAKAAESFQGMSQWHAVGRHLKTCECATQEARNVIREIYNAMEHA